MAFVSLHGDIESFHGPDGGLDGGHDGDFDVGHDGDFDVGLDVALDDTLDSCLEVGGIVGCLEWLP